MRGIPGILGLVLSAGLAACVFDGEPSPIDRRLRESCPENPFVTAVEPDTTSPPPGISLIGPIDSNGVEIETSIYNEWGTRVLHEIWGPSAAILEALPLDSNGNRRIDVYWPMHDGEGKHFPSGYYFAFISAVDESKAVPYSACFFYVNPKDADRVK